MGEDDGENGGADDVELDDEDLRLWGSERAALPAAPSHRVVRVEPENHNAAKLWLHMQTQWRSEHTVVGKHLVVFRTGLDYGALPSFAGPLGIEPGPYEMEALRRMEAEALRIFGRRQQEQLSHG